MRMSWLRVKIMEMFVLLVSVMTMMTIREGFPLVAAVTDIAEVQVLQLLYTSLNNPRQLSGWKSTGGDPCGESWTGVSCSGSTIISIRIPGLQLKGTLGYSLSNLSSLKILDISNNLIHDVIPYQLPPNLTYMNFGGNNLSGNLPYSISSMVSLSYLNASYNSLSQSVGDFFLRLHELSILSVSCGRTARKLLVVGGRSSGIVSGENLPCLILLVEESLCNQPLQISGNLRIDVLCCWWDSDRMHVLLAIAIFLGRIEEFGNVYRVMWIFVLTEPVAF